MNNKTEFEIRLENLKAERTMALSSGKQLRLLWIDSEIKKLIDKEKERKKLANNK